MNVVFYGADTAARNKEIFLKDLQECIELTGEHWTKPSRVRRIWYSLFRLIAPIL